MSELFLKISKNFKVSWDPVILENSFSEELVEQRKVTKRQDSTAHWQYFPSTNVRFSRNFHLAYPAQCQEVIDKLNELRESIRKISQALEHPMLKTFFTHQFDICRVTMIKVAAGTSVEQHIDVTRNLCINIGLKNSNTGLTCIWKNQNREYNNQLDQAETYVMEDGDVFILATKYTHAVKSLTSTDSTLDRYIISYTIEDSE